MNPNERHDAPASARWRATPGRVERAPRVWPQAVLSAAVLAVVAMLLSGGGRSLWIVAVPAVGAVVMPVVIVRSKGRSLRWVTTLGTAAGTALVRVLFLVLAVPLVLVPGLARGSARTSAYTTARWIRPAPCRSRTDAAWSNDRPGRPPLWAFGVVVLVALAAAFGLRTAIAHYGLPWNPETRDDGAVIEIAAAAGDGPAEPEVVLREPVPPGIEEFRTIDPSQVAALDASRQWLRSGELVRATGFVLNGRVERYENPFRIPDVRSRELNVLNGRRATWRPPCEGACDLPVVWFYGGSTAFGVDQRDDHTIASELARIAHADGIDLEVHNRGIPWFSHWQEAERFAWDLTAEGPPDLALFYDGYNDVSMVDPDEYHWNGKDSPIDSGGVVVWDRSGRSAGDLPDAPDGARRRISSRPAPTEYGQAMRTLDRYEKARSISRPAAAAAGVPVRYLWQPTRYDRPLVEGEVHWATDVENGWRKVAQVMGDHLPVDVLTLQDVLDDHLEPLFTDDVHHNEQGSRIIAKAIFDWIRPDIVAISGQRS